MKRDYLFSYKQKLSFCFFIIFALFTVGIILFERSRETKFRTEALVERLDAYAQLIESGEWRMENDTTLNSQLSILNSLRVTLIDRQGNVTYDNALEKDFEPENHGERPEITKAKADGNGYDIRTSATNNQKYLYYAKRTNDGFIRVALPYDIQVADFLKSDNLFLYYIALLFIVTLFLINYVADRFSKSIKQLRDFALSAKNNTQFSTLNFPFPNDELGEIGEMITENYKQIKARKKEITLEREKLLQHVHSSGEGLCFFSSDKKVRLYNGLFIQYLNTITDESVSDPATILTDEAFKNITDFLSSAERQENYYETQLTKHGKHFNLQANVFEDDSFEIIINDITKHEKTRLLKQEMTSNIAHELRTPVTSIRGYLEIALGQELDGEMSRNFLAKAHEQTVVLSELIQDMSLITKIEEAPTSFKHEPISIDELLYSLKSDLDKLLSDKNIRMQWTNTEGVVVCGNRNLLYSIFRNLTDNAIRYAGTDITITVNRYNEDDDFHYFSYADTGVGIPEEHHLNRLFKRFYRINEGRTRDTGGSGLGLAIVKNAVLLHKGTIVAKNRAEGGLEFVFKLPKT